MPCNRLSITFPPINKNTIQASIVLLLLFATVSVPIPHAKAQVYFREDFNYTSIADLQSAGWQVLGQCSNNPTNAWSLVSVEPGVVTILDDGSQGTALCHDISLPETDWSVETVAKWVGGNFGTMNLYLFLTGIKYGYKFWVDDYFGIYEFDRLGVGTVWTQSRPNLQPQVWYTLMVQKQGSTIGLYFDGIEVYAYQETDPNFIGRSLARVGIEPGWLSTISFDYVEVGSPTMISTITSQRASSVGAETSFTTGTASTNGVSTIYTIPQSLVQSLENFQRSTDYGNNVATAGLIVAILALLVPFYLDYRKQNHRRKTNRGAKRADTTRRYKSDSGKSI